MWSDLEPEMNNRWTRSARHWWDTRKRLYPFHATTPSTVRPGDVARDTGFFVMSVVLEPGTRTWGFKIEAERDEFVIRCGGTKI